MFRCQCALSLHGRSWFQGWTRNLKFQPLNFMICFGWKTLTWILLWCMLVPNQPIDGWKSKNYCGFLSFFVNILFIVSKQKPTNSSCCRNRILNSRKSVSTERVSMQVSNRQRKPRVLLAACGSVAALKFRTICQCFSEWADVRAVATRAALFFIDRQALPKNVFLYIDDDDWSSWKKIGDNVLHIHLCNWADIMVIAPLSANTLGKVILYDWSLFIQVLPFSLYFKLNI